MLLAVRKDDGLIEEVSGCASSVLSHQRSPGYVRSTYLASSNRGIEKLDDIAVLANGLVHTKLILVVEVTCLSFCCERRLWMVVRGMRS